MKKFISFLTLALVVLGLCPRLALAQDMWSNPFTGNRFNNPLSSTLDTTILFSMQKRLTQSQLLGTLPSQRGARRSASQPMAVSPQGGVPAAPPAQGQAVPQVPELQHYPLTATDFASGPRVLPTVYAEKGPKENQAQLVQTFNDMIDSFEKEGRKNNDAYAIMFLIGVSAQVYTGKEISDTVLEKFAQDINDILAASPTYRTMAASKKQELYESSVLMASMIGGLNTKPETAQDAKQLATQVLRSLGAIN